MSPATTELPTRETLRASSATRRAPIGKTRTVPRLQFASTDRTSAIAKHSRAFRIFPTLAIRPAPIAAAKLRANSPMPPTTSSAQPRIGASPSARACCSLSGPTHTTFASGIASSRTPAPPRSPISPTISATRPPTLRPCGSTRRGRSSPEAAWTGSRTTMATKRNGMDQRGCPLPLSRRSAMSVYIDPRLGLSRKLSAHWALTASGFRAYRAPTPSELYRSTQVGNQLTLPNGSLLSERATGWEAGVAAERSWGSIRSSYFLTQVNRPIVAVTTYANSLADSAHARKSRPDREPRSFTRL